jgi:hypothetical protein
VEDVNAEVQKLQALQRIRKIVVYVAIALIVASLLQRLPIFIYGRVALWATAGVLSVLEGAALKKLGHPASVAWFNAAIYFAVSLLPLLMKR